MKYNTLIVDGNSLLKNSFEATYKLDWSHPNINGIYTFLLRVRNQMKYGRHNRLRIVFDGDSKGILRRLIYPDYKKSRIKKMSNITEEKMESHKSFTYQKTKLKEYLSYFTYWYEDSKVEADDVIAYLVSTKQKDEDITIMTGDIDIMQLISEQVQILYLNKNFKNKTKKVLKYEKEDLKTPLIITHKNFKKIFGYNYKNIALIKTICGDSSDDISNIKGVKETSLFNEFPVILNEDVSLEDILNVCKTDLLKENISKTRLKILTRISQGITDGVQGRRILQINQRIVTLPSTEFITDKCINNLKKSGYLSYDKYKTKDAIEMVQKMQSDGLYENIITNFKTIKTFFKPFTNTYL